MLCIEFEARLQELLDDRRRPEQDISLQAHASECFECREVLDAQECLFDGLANAAAPRLSADFAFDVVAEASEVQRRRGHRFAWITAITVAAAFMLAVIPVLKRSNGKAATWPLVRGDVVAIVPPAPIRPANRTEQPADPNEFDAAELRVVLNTLMTRLSEARQDGFEPVDQIAGGLRPLTSTLNVAIDALRSAIPVVRPDNPSKPQANTLRMIERLHIG